MKRLIAFTLLLVYTTLASGVNVDLHYCGSKLKKISLFGKSDEKGCCGTKEKSKSCCKDKNSYLKVKDKHHSNSSLKFNFNKFSVAELLIASAAEFSELSTNHGMIITDYHSPPILYDVPIYLANGVLLI